MCTKARTGTPRASSNSETCRPVLPCVPPAAEVTRIAERAGAAPEDVGVQRDDDVGAVEVILRVDVLAEGERCAGACVLAARRVPLMPSG